MPGVSKTVRSKTIVLIVVFNMKELFGMQISTIIVNINQFNNKSFSNNGIGIEIQTFPQHILDSNIESLVDTWKVKLRGFKEPISIHGSSFDLNPGSTDKRIVDITRDRYLQSIGIADRLDARYLVFHSQVNPLLSVKRIRDMKLVNQVEFWLDLLDNHIPSSITILIENEYDDTYEDMKKIVEGVNRANFGICLDIGHVFAYSKVSLDEWISSLKNKIEYIHLHWNDKTYDEHRIPTNSELLQLRELLDKYNIDPIITLEYGTDSLFEETDRVRKMLVISD